MALLAPSQLEAYSSRRTAPFSQEPGFYKPTSLWLYGNTKLLDSSLGFIDETAQSTFSDSDLVHVAQEAESHVWQGKTLVTGIPQSLAPKSRNRAAKMGSAKCSCCSRWLLRPSWRGAFG